jgi:hypothetical protein
MPKLTFPNRILTTGTDRPPETEAPKAQAKGYHRVGFQKSAAYAEEQLHAARSYSLIKPPRTG